MLHNLLTFLNTMLSFLIASIVSFKCFIYLLPSLTHYWYFTSPWKFTNGVWFVCNVFLVGVCHWSNTIPFHFLPSTCNIMDSPSFLTLDGGRSNSCLYKRYTLILLVICPREQKTLLVLNMFDLHSTLACQSLNLLKAWVQFVEI